MLALKAKLIRKLLVYSIGGFMSIELVLAKDGSSDSHLAQTNPDGYNIVAQVNGTSIASDMLEFLSSSRQQGPLSGVEQDDNTLLEDLITTELLFHQAKQAKLDSDRRVSMELELAHKTLLSQLYVKHFMDQIVIDESTLRELYDAQPTLDMVQMELWHFDTESSARIFLENPEHELNKNNQQGAVQAWQLLNDYPFATLPEAKSLSSGEWLSVPVKEESGWQVWRCLDKSAIAKPSFEASREGLRQEIVSQHLQQHIASLRSTAQIKLYEQD